MHQTEHRCGKRYGAISHDAIKEFDEIYKTQGYSVRKLYGNSEKNMRFSDPEYECRYELFNKRINSLGDQKYKSPMLPGYTGFIPTSEDNQGKSFEGEAIYGITTLEERKVKSVNNMGPISTRLKPIVATNLNEINRKLFEYSKDYSTSPYEMKNDDKNKYFIPGSNT